MKKIFLFLTVIGLVFVGCGKAEKKPEYNYMDAKQSAEAIRNSEKVVFVDIQEKDDFKKEHLRGAIATYSYPVKTQEEKAKLLKSLDQIVAEDKVVIICPRGAGGAERAYTVFAKNGIEKSRLYILTNGQHGWPRDEISDVLVQE